ncbi:diphthine synthase [Halovivax gelatinilyticus]|uniref:diphthine synthase n=1 Tax=Halovivax gelatinilyticus TaxID=2961597 RepID=UPI0020CA428B|nr:diphthine synthase [Halovivax gelatinilyticus]
MLTFVGLGLYDETSITVEGRDVLCEADRVFAEFYTSELIGTTVEALEAHHDVEIEVRDRTGVEVDPDPILDAAETSDVVFLTAGDTMISTTHADLRLRARARGIETHIVHGITAQTAASGLTGLQNYRFGPSTTLPFPRAHGADGLPASVTNTIDDNRDRGLHTVVYLDIKAEEGEYMSADVGADLLAAAYPDLVAVVVARAGSPDPLVRGGRLDALANGSYGDPLHLLVVPGTCHLLEAEALESFADVDPEHLDVA